MVRGHQFNKVEMFQYTLPEKSWEAFAEMVKNAEKLADGLGLLCLHSYTRPPSRGEGPEASGGLR